MDYALPLTFLLETADHYSAFVAIWSLLSNIGFFSIYHNTWKSSIPALSTFSAKFPPLNLLGDIARQGDSFAASNFPIVLFLTDGEPTEGVVDGQQIRANILKANTLKASIFSLGFGFNLNMNLLTALSAENGGKARRIYLAKDAASQLEGFFDEISTPLLVRVRFEYPQDMVDNTQVTATEFSQHNDGSELVVSGKLS